MSDDCYVFPISSTYMTRSIVRDIEHTVYTGTAVNIHQIHYIVSTKQQLVDWGAADLFTPGQKAKQKPASPS